MTHLPIDAELVDLNAGSVADVWSKAAVTAVDVLNDDVAAAVVQIRIDTRKGEVVLNLSDVDALSMSVTLASKAADAITINSRSQLCDDCGEPVEWVEALTDWQHVNAAAADCFLVTRRPR